MLSINISPILMYGMEYNHSSYCSPESGMQAQLTNEETQLCYGDCPKITKFLSKAFYEQAIAELPIFCVDIFLLNLRTNNYLLVFRKNRPAQGIFCLPGGRLNKGESFFDAAKRKCEEEVGVTIEPKKAISVFNLIFPDSEWGSPAHTPAVVIFATCDIEEELVSLDKLHATYRWSSLFEPSNVDYTENARQKVLKILDH